MHLIRKSLISSLLGTILISLTSCELPNPPSSTQSPSTPVNSLNSPLSPTPTSTSTPTPTQPQTTITLYKPDRQCETLIPEPLPVSQQPLENTIREILAANNSPDFEIAGYRLNLDETTQTATLDLRVSPSSQRQLVSLSSCEQLALFGSLRKTLTENSEWNIEEVRFTERGEEIIL